MNPFATRLRALPPDVLGALTRGIEKESLRVKPDGMLADTPHPRALGSALTHPGITTDFSESQLELITGVHASVEDCLAELTELHQVVYRAIGDELLWCASMPCRLPAEDAIPLGQYGTANVGRLKTAYRQGLAHRYGRRMQTISGIHYNFSLPEAAWPLLQNADRAGGSAEAYQDRGYFALIRNFRRHSWLLLLLLGSSPAVCSSFLGGHPHGLTEWDGGTLVSPYGTSLRMGRLGYQSEAQASLAVSFNSLRGYAEALHRSLTEPYPPYEAIGVKDGNHYRQLATTLLQIENEFYGTIRPKRRIHPGSGRCARSESAASSTSRSAASTSAPSIRSASTPPTIRFLDIFLLHCLLQASPDDTPREIAAISRNQHLAAERWPRSGPAPGPRRRAGRAGRVGRGAAARMRAHRRGARRGPRRAGVSVGSRGRGRGAARTRQRCPRRGCCARPRTTTAGRFRALRSTIRNGTAGRCSTCRWTLTWRRGTRRSPPSRSSGSAKSRRLTTCHSRCIASAIWRRTC